MKRCISFRPLPGHPCKPPARTLRLLTATVSRGTQTESTPQTELFGNYTMSFSNTNTGDKPADPYKEKNLDDASIKDKVEDLSEFVTACKFGMMTTRDGSTGDLVSRCMASAAKVRPFLLLQVFFTSNFSTRKTAASTSSSTPTPSPARPRTSTQTHT
jgi:hypothetical protein